LSKIRGWWVLNISFNFAREERRGGATLNFYTSNQNNQAV